jgi:hypothetical protein
MARIDLPVNYTTLTRSERRAVRLQYVEDQGGKCMYCGGSLDKDPPEKVLRKPINWGKFPRNFLAYPIHLQHSHKTGMTEGAVHAYCNAALWQYHGR